MFSCTNSGVSRREIAKSYLIVVIASGAQQSTLAFVAPWIASRSLSSGAHTRDPLARKDGVKIRGCLKIES
jgi:hypothetical protein